MVDPELRQPARGRLAGAVFLVGLALVGTGLFIISREPDRGETSDVEEKPAQEPGQKGSAEDRLVVDPYPSRCLRKESPPDGLGLVATAWNHRVEVATPYESVARFRGTAPVSWSPSGRYLATGRGRLFDAHDRKAIASRSGFDVWGWSPVADCLVGVTDEGTLEVLTPRRASVPLLEPPDEESDDLVAVEDFQFSTDGRFLRIRWSYGRDDRGRRTRSLLDLANQRFLPKRTDVSMDFDPAEVCASCSADGKFLVEVQEGNLVLKTSDGTVVRRLTEGDYTDAFPEWGPPRTGVLFLRRPGETDRTEVWFIPEGGVPTRTPLVIPSAEAFGYPTAPWEGIIDWNVSPPRAICAHGSC